MNESGQYMVQVGDYDQNTFIIQDGVPVQYEGGTIISGELADATNIIAEPRWLQQQGGRGGKLINNQSFLNGDIVSVGGTGLNLSTRFTPSSIVLNTTSGTQFDQDSLRIASAVTGTGARGRPRGRKPSRGNFPVVPIDMVRQLGIEQQVILQPTVPVATKNKSTMAKPLQMSKLAQCIETEMNSININNHPVGVASGAATTTISEPTAKYVHLPVFIPVPIPVYIPVPIFLREKEKPCTEQERLCDEQEKPCTEQEKPCVEQEKTSVEQEKVCVEQDAAVVERVTESLVIEEEKETTKVTELVEDQKLPLPTVEPTPQEHIELNNPTITEDESHVKQVVAPECRKRQNTDVDLSTTVKQRKVDNSVADRKPTEICKLKYAYGFNAWRHFSKNENLLKLSVEEINDKLKIFVQEIKKPNNEPYVPDSILYLCLGIQLYLNDHDYNVNLFVDPRLEGFQIELNKILATFTPKVNDNQLVCRIEEDHLWEADQLGMQSPGVLVFSVCYFLSMQLKIKSPDIHYNLTVDQLQVTESEIIFKSPMDDEPKVICQRMSSSSNNNARRCFYTIVRTYLDKCMALERRPTNLYLTPLEKPDRTEWDPWFSDVPMNMDNLEILYNRIRILREVQECLLSVV